MMQPISICGDCLYLLANGELTDSEGNDIAHHQQESIDLRWEGQRLYLGGDDLGFSKSSCDACGTPYHGDRYVAYYDEDETPVTPA